MFITAKGWNRQVYHRRFADFNLADHTSDRFTTEFNRPNITHEQDFTKLSFRVSIPHTMGGDYLFVLHFTASDLAALFWALMKRNGLADLLTSLSNKLLPAPPSDQ